ncbi:unnamed protein product [Leptidea sinapis]|uniref:Nuclear respiratory factor 1 NLS/DNA-binding dimerisation domain-containing protein n=1 Tax=Leptidea sinapis TaxID=189913 RepID=A0A5E4QLC3_9NEOP|nr:unnamed protein product [Leptidea sinapis]
MIANLPLLFANGNPISLSKITSTNLEKFITFMVTCSWGHDTAKDIKQPPWWPKNVVFSHPFVRPFKIPQDWEARLKKLVKSCYDYHKSAFLLMFSAHLSRYPRNILTYVDNNDQTTSLYHRPTGRLLVTFRNENLLYDKTCETQVTEENSKPADIYLCDTCDSHFDDIDVLQAHERLCNSEAYKGECCGGIEDFLSALKLKPINESLSVKTLNNNVNDNKSRNVRCVANIDRGPPYPFSSLAYMKNAKINTQRDTTYSRERIERYCCTPLNSKNVASKEKRQNFPVKYRRPIDYWHRKHVFPDQRKKRILDVTAQLLLLKCKPIWVDVERMSLREMQEYIDQLKLDAENRKAKEQEVVFVDPDQDTLEPDLKIGDPLKKVNGTVCEVIDLCSDDEDSSSANENCDPRAGVTCVMRGGAVLRRNAATPNALPAEPSGARDKPIPLVLQPHPVILITHSSNKLQTITLD